MLIMLIRTAGFYHGRACAARDLNSRRWKKEEKGIMSLETTKKSQRFPTLGKKYWFGPTALCLCKVSCKFQLFGRATDEAASFEVMRGRTANVHGNAKPSHTT